MIALLLDVANILGGFLLAMALLEQTPRVGDDLRGFAQKLAPFKWIVGVVALVAGGYYLIVHLTSGPRLFHFGLVGIGVGVALLWDRLAGRPAPNGGTSGKPLLLAIFGLVAIIVGLQGLFTPNG